MYYTYKIIRIYNNLLFAIMFCQNKLSCWQADSHVDHMISVCKFCYFLVVIPICNSTIHYLENNVATALVTNYEFM